MKMLKTTLCAGALALAAAPAAAQQVPAGTYETLFAMGLAQTAVQFCSGDGWELNQQAFLAEKQRLDAGLEAAGFRQRQFRRFNETLPDEITARMVRYLNDNDIDAENMTDVCPYIRRDVAAGQPVARFLMQ